MKEALKLEREMKQLREVHAVQGRDGCWDIDDYTLGLYNGLELALSIVENREFKYKQRPKSQPEQEPVAWEQFYPDIGKPQIEFASVKIVAYNCTCGRTMNFESDHGVVAQQRTWVDLTRAQFAEILCDDRWQGKPELMLLQAQSKLKDKNTRGQE